MTTPKNKPQTVNVNAGAGIDPELLVEDTTPSESNADLHERIRQLEAANQALRDSALDAAFNPEAADGTANSSAASSKERYGIVVDEGSGQFDLAEVPVQVNGRAYQIRRGAYVEVPKEVISVLTDAVIDKAVSVNDPNGMPAGITMRAMRRFPFQNFGLAIDASGKRVQEARVA